MLSKILVALAIAFLNWYVGRKDIADNERLRIANESKELANKALKFKLRAGKRPDGGANLRVRKGAGKIRLSGSDANTGRKAGDG